MKTPISAGTGRTAASALVWLMMVGSPTLAMAHWGHLGEVAGHGHLIAVGLAGVIGLAVAGLAATRSEDTQPDSEDAETEETEATGDKAHA